MTAVRESYAAWSSKAEARANEKRQAFGHPMHFMSCMLCPNRGIMLQRAHTHSSALDKSTARIAISQDVHYMRHAEAQSSPARCVGFAPVCKQVVLDAIGIADIP